MNTKLIFSLSLFGLIMAFATVYFIPSNVEPYCWLGIFIVCAYLIAKNAPGRYFLHGFLVSLVNCVWVTGAHVLLYNDYLARHANEVAMMGKMNSTLSPQILMLITGPIVGIISGCVLGLFAWVASKMVNGTKSPTYTTS
jgi:hypothetical protein